MSLVVYFAGGPKLWPLYEAPLRRAAAARGLTLQLSPERPAAPEKVDYIIYAPTGPQLDFRPFTGTKAVLSLWAGVERIVTHESLTQPLCRMVDPGLQEGMVEWCLGQVLRHHLGLDRLIQNPGHLWQPAPPPLARQRPVGILGLGALGAAVGQALAALHFPVSGWSRQPKDLPGITGESGAEGLARVLAKAQILITLLPLTAATENLLNTARLAQLPRGAVILNPGRGALIDDAALLAALDKGQIGHATLDVFRQEPLPPDHPFWAHPRVTVSPHIAAETRPESAAEVIVDNIARGAAGLPFRHLVDRARGY